MDNSKASGADSSWTKPQPRWRRRDGLFRFTVQQFCRLDELGYFEDRKVELIRGLIFEMAISPRYAVSCNLAAEALRRIFSTGWVVSHQRALDLGQRSLPVPDLYVTAGSIRDFTETHPTTAALVVETSEATLRKDRTIKLHLYAQANLPEY